MAKNTIGNPPFPPVVVYDMNGLFLVSDLQKIAGERPKGASICLRYADGPKDRGGYFFHFVPAQKGKYSVYDFSKRHAVELSAEELVALINHCTGQQFDEASFDLCQRDLNFLKDE